MIQVQDLRYRYPSGSEPALCGISFDIARGESFGFLGPSGSGKSTTQKVLFRLLAGYQGSACIDGSQVRDLSRSSLYERIGVSFELPNHYLKLSALENLRFFGGFYNRPLLDPMMLLERLGLAEHARRRVGDYSKGMKMRLNIARALLHDPEILFFDEPTSGLDPVNARLVKDLLLEQKAAGKTLFVTTHQMHDAEELCDRVAFIVQGELKALDSPARLRQQHSSRSLEVRWQGQDQPETYPLDDLGQNAEFLKRLQSTPINTMHSKEATLEDIFILLTGKSLQA